MTFYELKQKTIDVYPAVILDSIATYKVRAFIRKISLIVLIFSSLFILLSIYGLKIPLFPETIAITLANFKLLFRSFFFFSLVIFVFLELLEAMYLSYYFKENDIDFEVLKTVSLSSEEDLTGGFLRSNIGRKVMQRLNIELNDVDRFLTERIDTVTADEYLMVQNESSRYVSFADYGRSLIHYDTQFKHFLDLHKITGDDFKGALLFVSTTEAKIRNIKRWWTRERLVRVPSIGSNWSFGKVFLLERYGHNIVVDSAYLNLSVSWRLYQKYIELIEQILLKKHGANVMLISETNSSAMSVIAAFSHAITRGETVHELEHKRIFVLDISLLLSIRKSDGFETVVRNIFDQAKKAGNVIIVIPNMSTFMEQANNHEIDLRILFDEVMESNMVNIVGVTSQSGYHESIETNIDLMKHFDKLLVDEFGFESVFEMVQNAIVHIEKEQGIFFTYQSVREIVEGASRYFSEGLLIDKAIDILEEITAKSVVSKSKVVTVEDIQNLIEQKTGIPLGELTDVEKEVFNNLENELHNYVIGQEEAISSISNTLRRSRSGLVDADKPIGTFLFLGPTGVGKTETAKALANTFFKGDDVNMVRLDMSEFSAADGLTKLIGSKGESGYLSGKIRDHKYGVLLLDEFEKASTEVHDLFLQILDEGFFTNSRGEKIDVRNMIVIATSNAGSDLIYKAKYNGENLADKKEEILDHLISSGIFKPELLNRFDDVILFHTLSINELKAVATIMLQGLNQRIKEKGIEVQIDDNVLDYLVKVGGSFKFGGRAIERAIQDEIEALIAKEYINGNIQSGMRLKFFENQEGLQILAE